MEVTIYCIEDINDLKYVGSTTEKLNRRLTGHRQSKNKKTHYCSSEKLNLEYCIIYELEKCDKKDRKEKEKYWINEIECVNEVRFIMEDDYYKKYYQKNKEKMLKQQKDYYYTYKAKNHLNPNLFL
jgi:hypothetical protein